VLAAYGTAWINYIGKHHRRSQKHIIFARYTFIYGYIILHFYIIAQCYTTTNHYILANVAIISNNAVLHNVAKVPDMHAFANSARLIYIRRWMNIIILLIHNSLSNLYFTFIRPFQKKLKRKAAANV